MHDERREGWLCRLTYVYEVVDGVNDEEIDESGDGDDEVAGALHFEVARLPAGHVRYHLHCAFDHALQPSRWKQHVVGIKPGLSCFTTVGTKQLF